MILSSANSAFIKIVSMWANAAHKSLRSGYSSAGISFSLFKVHLQKGGDFLQTPLVVWHIVLANDKTQCVDG